MDLHQKNSDLYERLLKSAELHMRVNVTSGIAKADLSSATLCATETDDAISAALDLTLSPTPSDVNGRLVVALKGSELAQLRRVLNVQVLSADSAFGTVVPTASITANNDVLIYLDSNQDITGDDGNIDIELKLLFN